ncbi:MAG: hypothetical protein F4X66_20955 [Chloroflexi bacterium]|nr:hypothetical protein [Chloroflexota bacterium]MYE42276.1 hypothetical protein [Chloroflexota bacterium]
MKRFLDVYWVIYFIGYLVAVAVMLWLHWDDLLYKDNLLLLLATIYGVAAGSASAFAIIVEGGGYIVLLIPKRVKELINEGRKQERAEWIAWLKRRREAEANNQSFDEPPPSERE